MPDNSAGEGSGQADITALQKTLVADLKANHCITTKQVEAAFSAVPRHLFLPDFPLHSVYSDQAIPTRFEEGRPISSSSQPAIMAIMLEQLGLQPGHRVLEIGAGTGYNAALMAHIVGQAGKVTAVDLDEDIVVEARAHLAAAGFDRVHVVCGDGMHGCADDAPYDCIILTVGGWDIPPVWLEQLKPDGRILLPLSLNGPQLSVALDRTGDHLTSTSIRECGFMRLRGEFVEPEIHMSLDADSDLTLSLNGDEPIVDSETVYQWLMGVTQDWPTGVNVTPREIWGSLRLWLALREPRLGSLYAKGSAVDREIVPPLFSSDGEFKWCSTSGIVASDGLGMLFRSSEQSAPAGRAAQEPAAFTLFVRGFGPAKTAARRLLTLVKAWDEIGRPGVEGLRIRAHPVVAGSAQPGGDFVLTRRWCHFVLDWLQTEESTSLSKRDPT